MTVNVQEMKTALEAKIEALEENQTAIQTIEDEHDAKIIQLHQQEEDVMDELKLIADNKATSTDLDELITLSQSEQAKKEQLAQIETLITNTAAVTKNKVLIALDTLFTNLKEAEKQFYQLDKAIIPESSFKQLNDVSETMATLHHALSNADSYGSAIVRKYNAYRKDGTGANYSSYTKQNGEHVHLSSSIRPSKIDYLIHAIKQFEYAESINLL